MYEFNRSRIIGSSCKRTTGEIDKFDRDEIHSHCSEFRAAADKIARMGKFFGIEINPYNHPSLPIFGSLPIDKKIATLKHIKSTLLTMESVEKESVGQYDDRRFTWKVLSTMGLVPPSDLFSLLTPRFAIEVYNLNELQIWRNFNFFNFCSYSLEEIFSIEWYLRYKRDPVDDEACISEVRDLLSGKTPDLHISSLRRHELEETISLSRLKLSVEHRVFARLKDKRGCLAAWLVASNAEVVGSARQRSAVEQPGERDRPQAELLEVSPGKTPGRSLS